MGQVSQTCAIDPASDTWDGWPHLDAREDWLFLLTVGLTSWRATCSHVRCQRVCAGSRGEASRGARGIPGWALARGRRPPSRASGAGKGRCILSAQGAGGLAGGGRRRGRGGTSEPWTALSRGQERAPGRRQDAPPAILRRRPGCWAKRRARDREAQGRGRGGPAPCTGVSSRDAEPPGKTPRDQLPVQGVRV